VSEHDKTANGLDRRIPQTSEGARIDKRLSWSGRLPEVEPNRDVDLLDRIQARLRGR